ncbi:hypothetical protein CYMTET_20081 [Cymbomonas tetramitiformis]|uniref:phosphoserine transaminase n=1 Tax=Cymbomonas tetramitiformis TaxID=36881 RepID=A0AAE0G634_9CHLO|nr:hypothetical protein CYMTET_20081 [Cymbomonas tetramitiformis]
MQAPLEISRPAMLRRGNSRVLRNNGSNYKAVRKSAKQISCVSSPAAPTTDRLFNFSAGPACLPIDVLQEAQEDLINWKGSGMSVMEMSHRGKDFISIADKAEADLRALMGIPDNYKVLFLQGGASTQFASIPLNFTTAEDTVDYIQTGSWGSKAIKEAQKYVNVNVAATDKPNNFTNIPAQSEWELSSGAKYLHFCANETIQGVEFKYTPEVGVPLIADFSSNFLSKPVDVSKYGMIYAGVQKNLGPAGCTVVIVRDDLLGNSRPECPAMLDYAIMAENDSMYNTPPCFSIYMCGLVLDKLLKMGGLSEVEKNNKAKAAVIYDAISGSDGYYNCPVNDAVRSCMNIPFTMADSDLEKEFIATAAENGLVQLKGHRSVGGMRASVYNAMPMEGAEKLAKFMKEFQSNHS